MKLLDHAFAGAHARFMLRDCNIQPLQRIFLEKCKSVLHCCALSDVTHMPLTRACVTSQIMMARVVLALEWQSASQ